MAFEPIEWQALWCAIHHKSKPPKKPPILEQVVRWVAQLGECLARKHDGNPGVKTLWRGLSRLHDIEDTWRLAHD
ncbi:MAG: IS4 family transposase [Thermosynechococcaceae cyanobacterium]